MPFINTITFKNATGKLKRIYEKVKGPKNTIDNILMIHSLRPHTLTGHMALYKNVLHHNDNEMPKWFLETVGIYVSILNNCQYCVDHHYEGLRRLLNDDERAAIIKKKLISNSFESIFEKNYSLALRYARVLTLNADQVTDGQINEMKMAGLNDGKILEINQVVSYFNYANRTVLGLGVDTNGDLLGLSPNASEDDNWSHK